MNYIFAFFLALASLTCSMGQSDTSVEQRVETLRKLMVDPDEKKLDELLSSDLSYGHSSGKIENKASLIRSLVSGESNFVSIDLKEQSISVTGDVAIVRHQLIGTTKDTGKPEGSVKIGVLLVWLKADGSWSLLARQAFKL